MKHSVIPSVLRRGSAALCALFGTVLSGFAADITQTWDVGTTVSSAAVTRSVENGQSVFLFTANGTFTATVDINVTVYYYYDGNDGSDGPDGVHEIYDGSDGKADVSAGRTITVGLNDYDDEWGSIRIVCAANESHAKLSLLPGTTAGRNASGLMQVTGTLFSGSGYVMAIFDGNITNYCNNGAVVTGTGKTPGTSVSCTPAGLAANTFHTWKLVATNGEDPDSVAIGERPFFNGQISIAATSDADEGTLTPGVFTISRPDVASAKTQPLEVAYTIGGTAVGGTDYVELPGKVTIPTGQASVRVPVNPLFNSACDVDTTVTLSLGDGPYLWNAAASTATIVITNGEELVLSDIYVDSKNEIGNGSLEKPFHSLREGCALASTNTTIWVRGGEDRSYRFVSQADVARILKDNVAIRAWGTDDAEPVDYEDTARMAVVTIDEDWKVNARNDGVPPIVVEGANVTIRGLCFRFKSASLYLRENNTTYVNSPIILASKDITVDTCEFLQQDTNNGQSGGLVRGVAPECKGFTVRGCWFHADSMNTIGAGVVSMTANPASGTLFSLIGNRFDRVATWLSGTGMGDSGNVSLNFISNRVVNCSNGSEDGFICQVNNSGPKACEMAYNIFFRENSADGKTYYALSHGGGYGNSFWSTVKIHHNTVIGYDGFLYSKRYFRGDAGHDIWTPQVFDNLVMINPEGGAFIVEGTTGDDMKPWKISNSVTNSSGYLKGSIVRDNAYKGDFSGGPALDMPGYDLLSCLTLTDNVVFQNDPRFLTNVIAGLDGYRFLDAAYPWCTNGWTGENGEYPPYYGALEPATADMFAQEPYPPFLSEIDVVKNDDLSFTISGSLAAGAGKLKLDLDGTIIPLTEGGDTNAVFEYETTVSMDDVLATNTCYAVTVNATNRFGKADSRSWYAAFLTGEVRIEGTYDARESQLRPGRFTISRPNGYDACRHPLTVFYEVMATGTAQPGVDYEPLSGSIVIPANENAVFLDVTPILNPAVTVNTTVEVRLLDYYYYLSDEGRTAMIQIRDNTPAVGDIYVDSLAGNGEENPGEEYEGNGTLEFPYREIWEAAFTAKTSGDVIHVNSGEGRSYPIEDESDLITIATANVTIRPYVIHNGRAVDTSVKAPVEISADLGLAVESPSVITVPVGCDNVTISGLDFHYFCKNAKSADGNSLGNGGHVIDVTGERCCISNCTFRQTGEGNGSWGGNRPVYAGCTEHMQGIGFQMKVFGCRFENIRGGNNQYAINASRDQDIIGNTFTNCQYCFWPLKAGWAGFDFVSNRVIDCKTIKTTSGNWQEMPVGNFGYNIFKTSTGEPFITKGRYGFHDTSVQATLPTRIHHNTIIGNGPLAVVEGDQIDTKFPTWAPLIYNNLLIQEPGTTNIVENTTIPETVAFADGCYSSFQTPTDGMISGGPGAYFASNAVLSGVVFHGGNLTMVPNYDLSKGLNVFDNDDYELAEFPHFMSNDPESPDFCRYVGAEYPQFIFCERKYPQVRARFFHVTDWIGAQKPLLFDPGTQLFFR